MTQAHYSPTLFNLNATLLLCCFFLTCMENGDQQKVAYRASNRSALCFLPSISLIGAALSSTGPGFIINLEASVRVARSAVQVSALTRSTCARHAFNLSADLIVYNISRVRFISPHSAEHFRALLLVFFRSPRRVSRFCPKLIYAFRCPLTEK